MADQLAGTGGTGAVGPIDRMMAEPTAVYYDLYNFAYGLNPGTGQAFGGTYKGTPGGQIVTTGPWGQQVPQNIPAGPPRVQTLNETLSMLHNLPPDKLGEYQRKLYAAGFYPDKSYSKGATGPNGKIVSQEDISATINLLSTAQGYVQMNPDGTPRVIKTIDEILNESIGAGIGEQKAKGVQGPGRVYQVTTSDPASLRQQVTRIGQALLGRALNDQEQAALVDQMMAAEKGPQEAAIQAGQQAEGGGDVRLATAQVDAEARLRERIKAQNPNEAQAYAEMNYVNIMRQMIGGNSPPPAADTSGGLT